MKIKVEQVGNRKFPRYVLALENGTFFDGTAWTPNQKKACLYAKLSVAKDDWRRLSKELESSTTTMTATVRVTVKAAQELTPEQVEALAWYMSSVSAFTLDYSKPRPEWLEIVSTQIVWATLKKQQKG